MLLPKIHIALPVLNESKNLSALIDCLKAQSEQDFDVVVCVNNYEDSWHDALKEKQCVDNQKSISFLKSIEDIRIQIINKSSKGKGWLKKKGGVGHARRVAMDAIIKNAKDSDLIVSIDADTYYPPDYLAAILQLFLENSKMTGLAVPYYHRLDGDETDRLILRYEIYMRYYALNMLRIKNPYAFTALGSAMVFPVWAYKKVGGLTPVLSGEDFYFLQKLVKNGKLGIWAETLAYPSPRFSDRVLFGTGPALIKGNTGNWDSYPIYHPDLFDQVEETFALFPTLYENNHPTQMDTFLQSQFNTKHIWEPLRQNYKDIANFVKACVNKVDGLRILQFLRIEQAVLNQPNEEILLEYVLEYLAANREETFSERFKNFSFNSSSIELLNEMRDFLFDEENKLRALGWDKNQ